MIFIYTLALIWLGSWWLAWWWVPLAAALVSFWRLRRLWRAMPQAFTAGCLAWLLPVIWRDAANASQLSEKMAVLFHLPGTYGTLAVTGAVGGLLAVLGAISGQRLRKTLELWRAH